ncbi:NAD-dependent protein deacetylase sirtuin-3, mitochondrial isoform X2 [Varanus komodoensis]|uniref:NAD-dependent protein deacetylase sirtuin-3, mitochondrial isoform X2 n=1 Tax=Varanus komodoensis TaxID=61221 RepID=UPI001CF7DA2A|nr:NAD-dependent protein deacetylase sirtuin-3, mitochondrial isoform X2 [Varanus komodoensis]
MNWKLHFRVSGGTNALCAGNFQRLMGWRYRWICVQHHHYRSPSGSVPFKNQSLISLRSVFNHPNGNLLLKRTSESSMKNMASMSGVRIMGVRPFSLSTAPMIIFGVGRGGNNTGKDKLTLKNVAELIQKKECRRVLVMAGAGLSTPSGIPDFRSPGSGLYSNLQQYNIPYPEAIFELNYFFHNPKPFFMLAKELYPGNYRPNYAHYFLRLLLDKGLLLRLYTQNIDGLERVAGIPPDKLVEAHGTFASATCTVCQRSYPGEDFRVEPFASLAGAVRASVPRVLINRDLVGPFAYQPQHSDVAELGDVIRGVKKVVELLGWKEELEELIKKEKEKLDAKNKKDV